MPKSKITVSTSGVAPGLAKLAELGGISLAISLHATNDKLRDEIVPINKYVGWIATCSESAVDWHERKECACTDYFHPSGYYCRTFPIKVLMEACADYAKKMESCNRDSQRITFEYVTHRNLLFAPIPCNEYPCRKRNS